MNWFKGAKALLARGCSVIATIQTSEAQSLEA